MTCLILEAQLLGVRSFSRVLELRRVLLLVYFTLVDVYHYFSLVTSHLLRAATVLLCKLVPWGWSTRAAALHLEGLLRGDGYVGRNGCSGGHYSVLWNQQ